MPFKTVEAHREWRKKRREAGLCTDCDNPRLERSSICAVHRDKVLARQLRSRYAQLTDEEYYQLRQIKSCQLCGRTPNKSLHIDHSHTTGKVRGVLCQQCNHMLGMAKDSPELLRKAAAYLEAN